MSEIGERSGSKEMRLPSQLPEIGVKVRISTTIMNTKRVIHGIVRLRGYSSLPSYIISAMGGLMTTGIWKAFDSYVAGENNSLFDTNSESL